MVKSYDERWSFIRIKNDSKLNENRDIPGNYTISMNLFELCVWPKFIHGT